MGLYSTMPNQMGFRRPFCLQPAPTLTVRRPLRVRRPRATDGESQKPQARDWGDWAPSELSWEEIDGVSPNQQLFKDPQTPQEEQIAAELKKLTARLAAAQRALQESEARQAALAPYRVSAPKRGIIGNSRYAVQLRKAVMAAARDVTRSPVLIFGEPGLEKTNVAAMIHNSSRFRKAPLVVVECDRLGEEAAELVGKGKKKGLLDWLPNEGTLILNNVHKAPPAVLPLLQQEVATATYAASVASMDDDSIEELLGKGGAGAGTSSEPDPSMLAYSSEASGSDGSSGDESSDPLPRCAFPRIIMTAETRVPELEKFSTVIKIPPLRVRPEDVGEMAGHMLRSVAKARGLSEIVLSRGALRQLEAGQYPNNTRELRAVLDRAVAQTLSKSAASSGSDSAMESSSGDKKALVISEEVLWFANPAKERLRMDLLSTLPLLRRFMRSDWWPDKINFGFTAYAFAAVVALLFLGPQDRDHNVALNVFWCYWWPGIFVVYIFLGRIWCAVCPFMIYGELAQRARLATGAKLMKWPKDALERWGPWFLFSLFGAILVWEEVWDLPGTAYLSSWLLVLITAGAVIGSVFYERRVWCRYLCPIGGMNGLFAKLSLTELRARHGVCSAECDTYTCYKGGPAVPPEGLATNGCPLYSHPAQLTDNRNCTLCGTCLKACPHGSIEFKFRVPGADIWDGSHLPIPGEAALMFMLLGAVYLHDLPTMLNDLGVANPGAILDNKLPHIAVSLAMLAVPGAVAWGTDAAWRFLAKALAPSSATPVPQLATASAGNGDPETARAISVLQAASTSYAVNASGSPVTAPVKPFVDLAYGYLPLVWAATLAYYLDNLLGEAGRVLPVAAATAGIDTPWLPSFVAHPAVIDSLQATFLAGGAALALGMTRRVSRQSWSAVAPQCALILVFTAALWHNMIR